MSDTQMLQAILDGQSAIKEELKGEIKKVAKQVELLEGKVTRLDENLTERIDKIGLQLAQLSDDVPTVEEFDDLKKQVSELERQMPKVS